MKSKVFSFKIFCVETVIALIYILAVLSVFIVSRSFLPLAVAMLLFPVSNLLIWFSRIRSNKVMRGIGLLLSTALGVMLLFLAVSLMVPVQNPGTITLGTATVAADSIAPQWRLMVGFACVAAAAAISLFGKDADA